MRKRSIWHDVRLIFTIFIFEDTGPASVNALVGIAYEWNIKMCYMNMNYGVPFWEQSE